MYAQAPQLPATSARPLYSLRKVQGRLKAEANGKPGLVRVCRDLHHISIFLPSQNKIYIGILLFPA